MVRTSDSLIRMDAAGDGKLKIRLPPDVRNSGWNYCETVAGQPFFLTSSKDVHYDTTHVRQAVFDMRESGELFNRRDYASQYASGNLSEAADSVRLGMAMPAPLLTGGASAVSAGTGSPWSRTQIWLRFLPAILSGLIAAWLCVRHQVTQGPSNRILWMVFVTLFGVFGYLGYRYHRRWPAPEFRTMRPNSFTAPAATGLEILEGNSPRQQ